MPAADLGPENPLPFFRDPKRHRAVRVHPSLPGPLRERLGWEAAFRVLPYRMQDGYTRERRLRRFHALVLENEYLAATFLPELGGRMISLVWKPLGRELLFRNTVFQPANLAIRDAWFAGGVEWNVGQFGHTFTTCAPLYAAAVEGLGGAPALRLYEFERCHGLFWQVDLHLPPGSRVLFAFSRVVNPQEAAVPMYWWTNVAVPETDGLRVLAPARCAVSVEEGAGGPQAALAPLPDLGDAARGDATYPARAPHAQEFFFQCEDTDLPFEAALDRHGHGLAEVSTPRLRYRKLFCWGRHPGGRHWQVFLGAEDTPYCEIQAGLAPTQLHGLVIPAGAEWGWLEGFTYVEADPGRVHAAAWESAWRAVDAALRDCLPGGGLAALEAECHGLAARPVVRLLHLGSGWGALESARRAAAGGGRSAPAALSFPESSLGPEEAKWGRLLEGGGLPHQDPAAEPGEWMVQPEWRALLEAALMREGQRQWLALLHAGVARLEAGDEAGAADAWRESLRHAPSPWACRNLAVLARRQGRLQAATAWYGRAWALAPRSGSSGVALAAEYLELLCALELWPLAGQVVDTLPPAVAHADRVQLLIARRALAMGDLRTVERVLSREPVSVREGESSLTDLWYGLWARRLTGDAGRGRDPVVRREIARLYPLPWHLDFRSFPG